jgi:nitrogen fixation protein NifU and related proteins
MADLRELYQELIIDHSRSPRNFGKLEPADFTHEGFNPLCGDKIIIYLRKNADKIASIKFEGCGCAISMASASMMTEALQGKNQAEIAALFANFHALVTTGAPLNDSAQLEKLCVLAGVSEFPMRVKCATLAWHTALAALNINEEKT